MNSSDNFKIAKIPPKKKGQDARQLLERVKGETAAPATAAAETPPWNILWQDRGAKPLSTRVSEEVHNRLVFITKLLKPHKITQQEYIEATLLAATEELLKSRGYDRFFSSE